MRLVAFGLLTAVFVLACSPPNGVQQASAQLPGGGRLLGFAVDGQHPFVLVQKPDGSLRSCYYYSGEWGCEELPPIPE